MGRWRASILLRQIFTNSNSIPNPNPPRKSFNFFTFSTPISKFSNFRTFFALPSPCQNYNDDFEYTNRTHDDFDQQIYIFDDDDIGIIPVKAYFLCTSIDLKGMQAENARYIAPPTSRSSNYIALRFQPPEVNVRTVASFATL